MSDLMAELVDWLDAAEASHPLVRAAMAHLHLVSIHPWADGNGRMSRSLQTLMIAREGVLAPEFSAIEAWLGRPGNTWEYYQVLKRRGSEYRPDQDVSEWIRFNLTAYENLNLRDLRELVRREILEPVGRTRARFYVAGARFPESVSEVARTPTTLSDPYVVG